MSRYQSLDARRLSGMRAMLRRRALCQALGHAAAALCTQLRRAAALLYLAYWQQAQGWPSEK